MELIESLLMSHQQSDELKECIANKLIMKTVTQPMNGMEFRKVFLKLTDWIISSDHRFLRELSLKGYSALIDRISMFKELVDPAYFKIIFSNMKQTKPVILIRLIITIFSKFQKSSFAKSLIPLLKPVRMGLVLYLGHHGNNVTFMKSLAQLYNMFPSLLPVTNQDVTQVNPGASNDVNLKIFDDMAFTDFRVVCSGKSFPCHKVFLAAQSPVLKAMIDSNMKEAIEATLELENRSEAVTESFVKYFYTGQVDKKVLNENAVNFLDLGEKYDMVELKTMAEQNMIAKLDKENMLSFFLAGDLFRGQQLRAAAKTFLRQNKASLKEHGGWKETLKERVDLLLELMETFM
eukprot:GFUD01139511.1.p1 GENE.GFUD01139511.1~~GFUD01139511.1.p1  ORF type:complete len:367 (-),score=100.47 GFUD01139511.1:32-1075(-)